MKPEIEAMHLLVERKAACKATHLESHVVVSNINQEDVSVAVETFTLHGRKEAGRAYVWKLEDGGEKREPKFKIVMGIPPVNSAKDAVASVLNSIRKAMLSED